MTEGDALHMCPACGAPVGDEDAEGNNYGGSQGNTGRAALLAAVQVAVCPECETKLRRTDEACPWEEI